MTSLELWQGIGVGGSAALGDGCAHCHRAERGCYSSFRCCAADDRPGPVRAHPREVEVGSQAATAPVEVDTLSCVCSYIWPITAARACLFSTVSPPRFRR